MNKAKRIELLKAMGTILDAVSDGGIYENYEVAVPTHADLDRNPDDYLPDREFSETLRWFTRLMSRASQDGGLWCDGRSSEDCNYKDAGLRIFSAAKFPVAPNQILYKCDTRWFISGVFGTTFFVADSFQVARTERLISVEDYAKARKPISAYNDLDATMERILSRELVKALKEGAVEGLTLEEAETIEVNWRGNDRKGNEW